MERAYPSFRIGAYDEALPFYVDFLGFEIDFEWRERDDSPVYMGISKGGLLLHLHGFKAGVFGCAALLDVESIQGLYEELKAKNPGNVDALVHQPWGKAELHLKNSWDNRLTFTSPTKATGEERAQPVLRISEYAEALEFYVDYLGFEVDFEWRNEKEGPVFMGISRGGLRLCMAQFRDAPFGSGILLDVDSVYDLRQELEKKNGTIEELINQPWAKTELHVEDPFGNKLIFTSHSKSRFALEDL